MRLRCPTCGEEYEPAEGEVGCAWPQDYFALSAAERARRGRGTSDLCRLDDRCFIRGVILLPVIGEQRDFGWGVWAEVRESAFERYAAIYEAEDQGSEPPFLGTLANRLPDYPETIGLPLAVQLVSAENRPHFRVLARSHPLAQDQERGIAPERVQSLLAHHRHES